MQDKKAKQLLKARLSRERQIYEMRKRAELKAAVSELERPWEVVEKSPNLFSFRADEQLKVLADRFQKPGGFDMWTEKDGPQLFQTPEELPSARFFPKGVVHSVKPYQRISGSDELNSGDEDLNSKTGNDRRSSGEKLIDRFGSSKMDSGVSELKNNSNSLGANRRMRNRRRLESPNLNTSVGFDAEQVGFDRKQRRNKPVVRNGHTQYNKGNDSMKLNETESDVYDMGLQQDGTYGFQSKNGSFDSGSGTINELD